MNPPTGVPPLVLVGRALEELIKVRFPPPQSRWAQGWFHSFMGSMWEGQLIPAPSCHPGQMPALILIRTCEYQLCSTGDGDGGDFMTGSEVILFKVRKMQDLGLPTSLTPGQDALQLSPPSFLLP